MHVPSIAMIDEIIWLLVELFWFLFFSQDQDFKLVSEDKETLK